MEKNRSTLLFKQCTIFWKIRFDDHAIQESRIIHFFNFVSIKDFKMVQSVKCTIERTFIKMSVSVVLNFKTIFLHRLNLFQFGIRMTFSFFLSKNPFTSTLFRIIMYEIFRIIMYDIFRIIMYEIFRIIMYEIFRICTHVYINFHFSIKISFGFNATLGARNG